MISIYLRHGVIFIYAIQVTNLGLERPRHQDDAHDFGISIGLFDFNHSNSGAEKVFKINMMNL